MRIRLYGLANRGRTQMQWEGFAFEFAEKQSTSTISETVATHRSRGVAKVSTPASGRDAYDGSLRRPCQVSDAQVVRWPRRRRGPHAHNLCLGRARVTEFPSATTPT